MQQSTIDHSSASSTREGEAPTSSRWGRPVPAARNEEVSFSGFFSAQTIKTDQVESEREETEVEGIEDWFVRQEEKVIILSWNYSGILTRTTNY